MSGAHVSSYSAHGHSTLKSYVVGFILSLGLTALSFCAVMTGVLPRDMILPSITLLAVIQLLVQLLFFLHLGTAPEQRNNTVIFLLTTLAITPLRKLTRQYWLISYRSMLGLYAFFYGCLHLTTYVWLDKFFDVHEMLHDIAKRRFITAGMIAFALMIPLALTSTKWSIRKLGKRWEALHRLIYFSAIAGVIHYWWLVKAGIKTAM